MKKQLLRLKQIQKWLTKRTAPGRSNLRLEWIREYQNELWEDCDNKIYNLLKNKFEMDIKNGVIEQTCWI